MNSRPSADLSFLQADRHGNWLVDVHVVPHASRTEPASLHGEAGRQALRLRLQAAPVDGKANAALVRWMADSLGVAARHITLVCGDSSRRKRLRIAAAAVPGCDWRVLVDAARGPAVPD